MGDDNDQADTSRAEQKTEVQHSIVENEQTTSVEPSAATDETLNAIGSSIHNHNRSLLTSSNQESLQAVNVPNETWVVPAQPQALLSNLNSQFVQQIQRQQQVQYQQQQLQNQQQQLHNQQLQQNIMQLLSLYTTHSGLGNLAPSTLNASSTLSSQLFTPQSQPPPPAPIPPMQLSNEQLHLLLVALLQQQQQQQQQHAASFTTGELSQSNPLQGELARLLNSFVSNGFLTSTQSPVDHEGQQLLTMASPQLLASAPSAVAVGGAAPPGPQAVQAAHQTGTSTQQRHQRLLIPIAMSTDRSTLSEYQCLLREQVVLFEADDEDVVCSRGRTKPVHVGQVGIVCKHCAQHPPRIRCRGASYFPAKLIAVYGAAQNMAVKHFMDTCYQIPDSIRSSLSSLKGVKAQSGRAGRQRWADDLMELGVVETAEGLAFGFEVEQRAQHYS